MARTRWLTRNERQSTKLVNRIRNVLRPIASVDDLDPLMRRIGDARYVLLGEASHGTAEYYTWRRRISERLIREKDFSFIAVEGDWPDCYRVNRYVKGLPDTGRSAHEVLHAFERWPTWMWANEEVVGLAEWLRHHNDGLPKEVQVGFYGLDVYSLWDSLHAVIEYLQKHRPQSIKAARDAYRCFEPFGEVEEYARATAWLPADCEEPVVKLLAELRRQKADSAPDGRDGFFNAEQNALVAKNAEAYYRSMAQGGPHSWNVRDRHMAETLDRLTEHHGPAAKAIVWEHNTHIGDARATDMAAAEMVNVGQLVRESHADEGVVLVGFASHRGSVIAGRHWEAPMERMPVPPAQKGSWEDLLHESAMPAGLLMTDELEAIDEALVPRGHRAIGVVYDPDGERYGNYVPTVLPRRYDALVYIDESHALYPLHLPVHHTAELPETYPSAF